MVAGNVRTNKPAEATGHELVIARVFDAPRELVFRSFTEVDRLRRWWGPAGFEWVSAKLGLRPGGVFHYCMRSPAGLEMWGKFVYREVTRPERIVFVNSFSDEAGGMTRNPWIPDWPLELLNTVTFIERDGQTTVTLEAMPIHASANEWEIFKAGRESMQRGFGATFDRLAHSLASNLHQRDRS